MQVSSLLVAYLLGKILGVRGFMDLDYSKAFHLSSSISFLSLRLSSSNLSKSPLQIRCISSIGKFIQITEGITEVHAHHEQPALGEPLLASESDDLTKLKFLTVIFLTLVNLKVTR